MTATIIIPAHNEETNIKLTLETLQPKRFINDFSIIVVCNGCNDKTAEIVETHFPDVHCVEIKEASKALAIRHAESVNSDFPRIYLDADILLKGDEALLIIEQCLLKNEHIIMPRSNVHLENSNFLVKKYYSYWYKTPFVIKQGYGCGVYALSENSRQRFNEWPDLISDDGYVRLHFSQSEVHILETACVHIKAPKTLWSLIKIKARSKYGRLELNEYLRSTTHIQDRKEIKTPTPICKKSIFSKTNYLFINLVSLAYAKWMYKKKTFIWLRDESNR